MFFLGIILLGIIESSFARLAIVDRGFENLPDLFCNSKAFETHLKENILNQLRNLQEIMSCLQCKGGQTQTVHFKIPVSIKRTVS